LIHIAPQSQEVPSTAVWRTERSLTVVRECRRKLKRKAVAKGPRGERDYFWSAEEDAILRSKPSARGARIWASLPSVLRGRSHALGPVAGRRATIPSPRWVLCRTAWIAEHPGGTAAGYWRTATVTVVSSVAGVRPWCSNRLCQLD
jgi:hypothetical protein